MVLAAVSNGGNFASFTFSFSLQRKTFGFEVRSETNGKYQKEEFKTDFKGAVDRYTELADFIEGRNSDGR